MSHSRLFALLAVVMSLAVASPPASAQKETAPPAASTYEPQVGQAGKDVVWVPTPQVLVDKMLDMAKATPNDFVMDLGSGDGRTVITAAKRGIRALGVEYDPKMVELSRRNAEREGVSERAKFVKADLFKTDFSRATVITMFLLPRINLQLRPKILQLKPGTRIVSNSFDMGEWEADETVTLDDDKKCENYCKAMLWIVPARVAGTHKTAQGELRLKQTFQKVSGTLRKNGKTIPIEGVVTGNDVVMTADGQEIRGKMNGKRLVLG